MNFEERYVIALRCFSNLFAFYKDSRRGWFFRSTFLFSSGLTIEIRILSLELSDVGMEFSCWVFYGARLRFCCWLLSSNPCLLVSFISFLHGFRRGDILIGQKILLFINFLQVFFRIRIKSVPLFNDFSNNLGLSELRELGFVLVVLLSRELTIKSPKNSAFALFTHSAPNKIL